MKTLSQKIKSFSQGNLRKFLLKYKYLKQFVPLHVREQIIWRRTVQDLKCKRNGACILCGCTVPGLEMANPACEKPCYPEMLDKVDWGMFKDARYLTRKGDRKLVVFVYDENLVNYDNV